MHNFFYPHLFLIIFTVVRCCPCSIDISTENAPRHQWFIWQRGKHTTTIFRFVIEFNSWDIMFFLRFMKLTIFLYIYKNSIKILLICGWGWFLRKISRCFYCVYPLSIPNKPNNCFDRWPYWKESIAKREIRKITFGSWEYWVV